MLKKIGYSDSLLLDASAWIEFFDGSDRGALVKQILENDDCYTSIVTLAEVTNAALKKAKDPKAMIDFMTRTSSVIKIDNDIAVLAGRLNFERKKLNKKWGTLDSFILASGSIYGLKILTKDNDFKDISDVEIL